jgi:7-cyano-7-deazaguanine synthase
MKAIVLLSGGLDSTVLLAMAIQQGRECMALSYDYGQRHQVELKSAQAVSAYYGCPHRLIRIDPSVFEGSSLIKKASCRDSALSLPSTDQPIPNTYVPARNTLFLSYAMGLAEALEVQEIYYGPNSLDYSAYPDCRPEFVAAFQAVLNCSTKQAQGGNPPRLTAPLIHWDKARIIKEGIALHAPLHLTHSCYDPDSSGQPCHACLACNLRREGFLANGMDESPKDQGMDCRA